jgi:transcriptional regulator with XRE-family HTH domain
MSVGPQSSLIDESLGRRLRRERERRQIALASIAQNSKISISLFQDLERDDVSRWPSGIYRRSFIRAYAKAIGLDADETMREFLERFPDPHDPARVMASGLVGADSRAAASLASPADARSGQTEAAGPVAGAPACQTRSERCPADAAEARPREPLRLTLVDTGPSFARGRLVTSARDRLAAIGCDAAIVGTVGLALYAVLGTLWMPLCAAMLAYYAISILLLGNTPGVCLNATTSAAEPDAKPSWAQNASEGQWA